MKLKHYCSLELYELKYYSFELYETYILLLCGAS